MYLAPTRIEAPDGQLAKTEVNPFIDNIRRTVSDLTSGEAMAIYLLLISQYHPFIDKKLIMARTGFGKTRYAKGMDELLTIGIVETQEEVN